jgi:hypothetical protein
MFRKNISPSSEPKSNPSNKSDQAGSFITCHYLPQGRTVPNHCCELLTSSRGKRSNAFVLDCDHEKSLNLLGSCSICGTKDEERNKRMGWGTHPESLALLYKKAGPQLQGQKTSHSRNECATQRTRETTDFLQPSCKSESYHCHYPIEYNSGAQLPSPTSKCWNVFKGKSCAW